MEARFNRLDAEVDGRFNRLDAKIDARFNIIALLGGVLVILQVLGALDVI